MAATTFTGIQWDLRRGTQTAFRGHHQRITRITCRAQSIEKSNQFYGYDLYYLLGVEHTAHRTEIKKAYRWLQKRCHPDIAGQVGHDMSILLNDAYSILSNPSKRSSYDALRAEWMQYEGFTGQPLYSRWLGPACEEKAVFVDEVRCIGCLKCALIASNTFAIEKKFGRARAVSQWGDPEPIIEDAIRACPVDCISWVERSKLPALEYLMSKQPRRAANTDASYSGGERVIDVFTKADKFLSKNAEFLSQKKSPAQTYRRAAADAVQARAGKWWEYLIGRSHSGTGEGQHPASSKIVPLNWYTDRIYTSTLFAESKMRALYEAVSQQRFSSQEQACDDDYWEPEPPIAQVDSSSRNVVEHHQVNTKINSDAMLRINGSPSNNQVKVLVMRTVPLATSLVAGIYTGHASMKAESLHSMVMYSTSEDLRQVLLQLSTTSGAVQTLLAAFAWYLISSVVCATVGLLLTLFKSQS